MERLKIRLHPLFILFGIYFAFTGKVFSFLAITLSALLHEGGHYLISSSMGYELNRITLMPYGAVLSGYAGDVTIKDEIKIALAGPMVSGFLAIFFTALWWIFPSAYPFTDLAGKTNAALFFVNLIPAYPLDGGRVLYALVSLKTGRKKGIKIAKTVTATISAALFLLFVYSCFHGVNLTIAAFSAFLISGLFGFKKGDYVSVYENFSVDKIKRPKVIKRAAISETARLKTLYSIVDKDYFYEITVVDVSGKAIVKLCGNDLYKTLVSGKYYESVGAAMKAAGINA